MFPRKKLAVVLAAVQLVLALVILVSPKTIFPLCEEVMHCHYSYMAELGVASAVIAASIGIFLSGGAEAPRLLSIVTAVCGIFVILFPSYLIGVCGSPKMACHYGLMPVWNLSGGLITLLSVIIFFSSREEPA